MSYGQNSRSVAEGYRRAGHDVRSVDTTKYHAGTLLTPTWARLRFTGKVSTAAASSFRRELGDVSRGFDADLLLAIKTVNLPQEDLLATPARVHAHMSFDDVSNPDNITDSYLEYEPQWDIVLTTKRHNVPELIERGVRHPHFVWGAYDPDIRKRTREFRSREYLVGFIGAARPDRMDLPRQFARYARGQSIVVGPRWRRRYPFGQRGVEMRTPAMGGDYTAVANMIRFGLVRLNSENRDRHTNRSIETPATGQLAFLERTSEHEELFDDGRNAVLFGSESELWERVAELAAHPASAERLADAGYRLITQGGFTYEDRAAEFERHLIEVGAL